MAEEIKNTEVESTVAPSSDLTKNVGELSFLEKAGDFFQGNVKYISIGVGSVLILVAGWFGYKKFIVEPENIKSASSLYQEESYLVDSQNWKAMIAGDSLQTSMGLLAKSKKYKGYAGGNIATYDIGIAYLNDGQPQEALNTFKNVSFDDENLATLALGAMGDANMDLGKTADAIKNYESAYKRRPKNEMTAPLYMIKLANAYELTENYEAAAKLYTDLIENFPQSQLKTEAEKNLVFVQANTSVYKLK